MSDDVIEQTETHRLRIVHDDDPCEPYDDGATPILRIECDRRDTFDVQQVGGTSFKVPEVILYAAHAFGDRLCARRWHEPTMFERYLRIFHGATSVVWHYSGDYHYVTFDTAAWREEMGLTDDLLTASQTFPSDADQLANMDEYIAYLNGECYGWVIEEREVWGRLNASGELATANYGRREDWAFVDSCWGYYGDQYVQEAGREAFADYLAPTVQVQREEV